jgi:lysophospholipase L1-like esterase
MRILNVFLAFAVSLTIFVLVLEGGLRLIPATAPKKVLNQPHATLGWSKQENTSTRRLTGEYDVTFEVNALGLRNDPMTSPEKPEGIFRVLCLGDSFTLGYAVEREDLFAEELERWWNLEGRKVEVINTGTEGYSTDQEALWLIENGEAFDPDLVLLFSYENDIYWNGQTSYFGIEKPRFGIDGKLDHAGPFEPPPPRGLEKTYAIANVWKIAGDKIRGMWTEAEVSPHVFHPEVTQGPISRECAALLTSNPPGFITDAVQRTRGALKALKEECERLDTPLVMIPIPSHSAIDETYAAETYARKRLSGLSREAWSPDLPVDTFLVLAENLDITALDPRPTLRATAGEGEELYFEEDWHFNPAGNRAFASFLHGSLDQLGVFPKGHRPSEGQALTREELPAPEAAGGFPLRGKVFLLLWAALTMLFFFHHGDEPFWRPPLLVGLMAGAVYTIIYGGSALLETLPPETRGIIAFLVVVAILGFVVYKLGRKVETIIELLKSFTMRGHWYLMPLVIVLVTIGSLLVVAASSPLVAPFIYTLF